ncbi:hypothetical protein D9V96_014995 [Zobellia laminariae]|uniref:hypothetical protein n=1 Tax=Zobellia laminariae TaxID=248906 RepID=UPI0012D8B67E|nr:hypothetical protein [Zobellia laminariae]
MKSSFTLLFLFVLLFSQACKDDDNCSEVACFTPPEPFSFDLVDKTSGENLFTNETYNANDISVVDLDDQSAVEFTFQDENDTNLIRINTIGWETETVAYSIQIATKSVFELYVTAERSTDGCCPNTDFTEIRIEKADFELNKESGIYTIFVD